MNADDEDRNDEREWAAWVGRSETLHDVVGPTPVVALATTLDHPPTPVPN